MVLMSRQDKQIVNLTIQAVRCVFSTRNLSISIYLSPNSSARADGG